MTKKFLLLTILIVYITGAFSETNAQNVLPFAIYFNYDDLVYTNRCGFSFPSSKPEYADSSIKPDFSGDGPFYFLFCYAACDR